MKLSRRDFVLLAIIIYFTFVGGTFYSQFNFWLRVANQLFVTALLGGWLVMRLKRREGLPQTPLDAALGLFVAVSLFSALIGQSPRYSFEVLWLTLVHVLAFYLLVDLARRGWATRLTWAFYMTAAVVCLVGLAEYMAWYFGAPFLGVFQQGWLEVGGWRNPVPPYLYRLNITLNGSTPLASYLSLLITPAVGLILSLPRRDPNRQALIGWLFLALPVQVLTFSRAGILALAISLTLLVVGYLWLSGMRWANILQYWQGLSRWVRLLVVGVSLVLLTIGIIWLQTSFTGRQGSTGHRLTLWQGATLIFQENWFAGVGPGNFGRALLRLNDSEFPRLQIATAHSIYFNTAAELGLLGLLVGGYFYFAVARSWLRHWSQLTDPAKQIRLIAVGASLVGLAVQLLVDTYAATPNILGMMALLAYLVPPLTSEARRHVRRWPAYVAGIFLLAYLVGLAWIALADYRFEGSLRAERAGDLPTAINRAEAAYRLDPALTQRLFRLALLEARLAAQTQDPLIAARAIDYYQTGLAQEPIWGLNSANLAGLLASQGQLDEAIGWLERTLTSENRVTYWLNLGYFYEQQQNWGAATFAYGQVLRLQRSAAGSGFWQATPARSNRWPQIVSAALEPETAAGQAAFRLDLARVQNAGTPSSGEEALALLDSTDQFQANLIEWYLYRGELASAAALLKPVPESGQDRLWWGRYRLQNGELDVGETLLKTAAFQRMRQAYFYLGQLYEQRGELQAAETAYQRAFLLSSPENIDVTIYGRYGGNDLAPQLIQLGDPQQTQTLQALVELYRSQQRSQEIERLTRLMNQVDPFLSTNWEQ